MTDRFKKADAQLNDTYKKLLNSLSPTDKTQLQNEERAWLTERDIFATIHSSQSWSPFPNASRIEGMAIATEKRVAELQKRLAAKTGSGDARPVQRIVIFPIKQLIALVAAASEFQAADAERLGTCGIVFDRQGNLFVADHASGQILKFATDGARTVFAADIKSPYGAPTPGK